MIKSFACLLFVRSCNLIIKIIYVPSIFWKDQYKVPIRLYFGISEAIPMTNVHVFETNYKRTIRVTFLLNKQTPLGYFKDQYIVPIRYSLHYNNYKICIIYRYKQKYCHRLISNKLKHNFMNYFSEAYES